MIYVFGDYELDTQRHELRHAGTPCPLEPQVYAVLLYLIRHNDRVVSKQELLDQVWPETFVSESTLYQRLRAVRQAVGDSGRAQRVIKTVHKQGYRFSAMVEERQPTAVGEEMPDSSVAEILPVAPSATDRMPGAERKLVTVLCGTLANAELLADRLGFASLGRLRQTLFKLTEAEVAPYAGTVQPYGDDGFLALFGVPVVHEDHPRRAILAALALRHRLRDVPPSFDLPQDVKLEVRLGIHTGLLSWPIPKLQMEAMSCTY